MAGSTAGDPLAEFLRAAVVPLDAHAAGTLERAEAIRAAHPDVAGASIHAAAVLGDADAVRRFLAADGASATAAGGPHGWDALTHLCFSRYLRLDSARSDGFVRAAEALLDAGASANTGFQADGHQPEPTFESALYGAAGVAHHPGLTRLLLERGADPNDDETPYHAPEGFDNRAMEVLVESGKLSRLSLATLLHRKLDWPDHGAVAWLLAHGADPNAVSPWGRRALDHALERDSPLPFFETLLDHGADPSLHTGGGAPVPARAAELGRADVLDLFERRGFTVALTGDAAFLAACARADEARAREMAAGDPALVDWMQSARPALLAGFAGAGNTDGVRLLLDLGFDVASRSSDAGARGDTALHRAVWRGRAATVRLLLERGAPLEAVNGAGDTPLALAVRALTEPSEWTPHPSPEIVEALLRAGASPGSVKRFPTGSPEADALLRQYGRTE